jgi:hypothetical protein
MISEFALMALPFLGIAIVSMVVLIWLILLAFPLKNVSSKGFISNAYKFRKQLKEYRSWDRGYINDFAAAMYRDMAHYLETEGCHIGREKTARRARVIAHLLTDDNSASDEVYNNLLSEWWDSREELPCKEGTRMIWGPNPALQKRIFLREKIVQGCSKHRKELLLTYLSKYHSTIWD